MRALLGRPQMGVAHAVRTATWGLKASIHVATRRVKQLSLSNSWITLIRRSLYSYGPYTVTAFIQLA